MNILKEKLISIGKKLDSKGLSPATSGNISIRTEKYILISPSGNPLGEIAKEDIAVVTLEGKQIDGEKKPSMEINLHAKIYKKRDDINAIIHYHSPKPTAFAVAHADLSQPVLAESVFYFGKIPLAEYYLPGSEALAEETSKFFDDNDIVLMKNHGVIIGARTIEEAYLRVETLEATAETILWASLLGGGKPLSEKQIQEITELKNASKS